MEDINNKVVETTSEVQAQSAPQVSEVGSEINQAGVSKAGETGGEIPAAQAYTPNYKFKAAKEEKEFDEWLRPVIKDADTEKKVRELYEKAFGLDSVKESREKLQKDFQNLSSERENFNRSLEMLNSYVAKNDFHSFFKALDIPEKAVLQYAMERLRYYEMPAEEKQRYDASMQEKSRLTLIEQQNQYLMEQMQRQQSAQLENELNSWIEKPEIKNAVESFDARAGYPGAFRDEVIRRGQYYAMLPENQRRDLTVEEAVKDVLRFVGGPTQPQAQMVTEQQAPVAQSVIAPQDKPIIPNIKGKGTSPAKKVIKSIDDLRKLSAI